MSTNNPYTKDVVLLLLQPLMDTNLHQGNNIAVDPNIIIIIPPPRQGGTPPILRGERHSERLYNLHRVKVRCFKPIELF